MEVVIAGCLKGSVGVGSTWEMRGRSWVWMMMGGGRC